MSKTNVTEKNQNDVDETEGSLGLSRARRIG
jgi:hypothetical protein